MIRVFLDGDELDMEFMTFTGGERHVKIKGYKQEWIVARGSSVNKYSGVMDVEIYAYLDSSDAIMDLILVKDALDRIAKGALLGTHKILYMPYIPYARQDRVMVDGEPLSSAAFAPIINMLNFDRVIVDDPHSDVSASHLKNVIVNDQGDIAINILGRGFFDNVILVAPDSGAMKKTTSLAKKVNAEDRVGFATKSRDVTNGHLKVTGYSGPELSGETVLIVDDLADRGGTFIQLAKFLREKGAEEIFLYVTHGIFASGIDEPFAGVIDRIYTAYPWVKNVSTTNGKNILIKVDTSVDFE